MLEPPSATAVAVGIAISSTSRDRTRQFLRIRPRNLVAAGLALGSSARGESTAGPAVAIWARIAGSRTSVTGRPAGRPTAARAPASEGPAGPGPASRDFLLRHRTVGVPLT